MNRFIKVFLTVIIAVNLVAASALAAKPCNMACCMPQETQAKVESACEHCSPRHSLTESAAPCCDMRGGEAQAPATLNTGNTLPNLDIASLAGETPVRFAGAITRPVIKHATGAYESPPIFLLNATFIC